MPTYETTSRFRKDLEKLSVEQRAQFQKAVTKFVEDLRAGRRFRRSLRVKGIQGAPGVFEMSWAADGRSTFEYGKPKKPGELHVIWRRVGSHVVFDVP